VLLKELEEGEKGG